MKDLKSSYNKQLSAFAALNICAFWFFLFYGLQANSLTFSLSDILKSSVYVALSPIVTLVLSGLISADSKACLAYWRFANPLPGTRAFQSPIIDDPRIDVVALKSKVGKFPEKPGEQNRLWYQLMKAEEKDHSITQSHRQWLFARDLTGYSFAFLLVFGIAAPLSSQATLLELMYVFLLVLQYLVISFSAQNYGIRFVQNVLAKVSSKCS